MGEHMTKADLIDILRSRRAELDKAFSEISEASMLEPGAAGHWSVKDIIAHLTYYEGWMTDRMQEQLDGKTYAPTQLDMIHWEPRNTIVYEQNKQRTLEDVTSDSRNTFQRLLNVIQEHDENFLFQPQVFEGAPNPVIVADMIRSEVYDHYPQHVPSLHAWAAAHPK